MCLKFFYTFIHLKIILNIKIKKIEDDDQKHNFANIYS